MSGNNSVSIKPVVVTTIQGNRDRILGDHLDYKFEAGICGEPELLGQGSGGQVFRVFDNNRREYRVCKYKSFTDDGGYDSQIYGSYTILLRGY